MAYGTLKVDSITFTNGGADQTITVSGIVQSISGDITATGTIQAATIIGTSTVSGATVTGDSGQYGNLNSISGVFTTQISGTTITGDIGQYTTLTGISGVFTTQVSGATVTGNTGSFTTVTGGVATITSGVFALGEETLPSISFSGDPDTGIYSPGADQIAISTSGTGKLFIDSAGKVTVKGVGTAAFVVEGTAPDNSLVVKGSTGNVGLGTSTPQAELHLSKSTGPVFRIGASGSVGDASSTGRIEFFGGSTAGNGAGIKAAIDTESTSVTARDFDLLFKTSANVGSGEPTERLRITADGNVGIGTTSPASVLDVRGTSNGQNVLQLSNAAGTANGDAENQIRVTCNGDTNWGNLDIQAFQTIFTQGGTERARIDNSGRLLVGTSSARTNIDYVFGTTGSQLQIEKANATTNFSIVQNFDSATAGAPAIFTLARSGATSIGSNTIVANGNRVGEINFSGSDGTDFTIAACIRGEIDGTPGANDMPGRLVFSTTADGASSPTERMKISSNGSLSTFTDNNATLRSAETAGTAAIVTIQAGSTNIGNGTTKLRVMADGDVENATGVYTSPVSDERFKIDIVDVGTQWDDIKHVKLKKFRFKNNPDGELQLGIIAQELEAVCPNLIKRKIAGPEEVEASKGAVQEGEEYLSWKASILPLKAVKALQEAMERIETLEAKVAALESA